MFPTDRRLVVFGLPLVLGAAAGMAGCAQGASAGALPDDMTLGDPKAKVAFVEYASVACPVCGRWYREVFPAFKAKYVDTGRVRFVYREMLVGGAGEVAIAAAGFTLARCAGPGRYFPVVDAIYRNQGAIFENPKAGMLDIARGLGFTDARFDACVRDEKALAALQKRVEANSRRDGVDSTPTFVVDGRKMAVGYHTLEEIDAFAPVRVSPLPASPPPTPGCSAPTRPAPPLRPPLRRSRRSARARAATPGRIEAALRAPAPPGG